MIKNENEPQSEIDRVNAAFKVASRDVIDRARRFGTDIVIWRDGKIVSLSPEDAERELK